MPFLAAAAAVHGFAQVQRVGGFGAMDAHMACLARWLSAQLLGLRHGNGRPVCVLYGRQGELLQGGGQGPGQAGGAAARCSGAASSSQGRQVQQEQHGHDVEELRRELQSWQAAQGPVVTFNLLRANGSYVGYTGVCPAVHGWVVGC